MRNEERKQRLALTLLFSGVVFCSFMVTMVIVGGIFIFLIHKGVLEPGLFPGTEDFIINIAIWSVLLGTVLTAITSRIPLKPVNKIINALNQLASGDFKTRLNFGKPLGKYPTAVELTDSFNRMAEELENMEMLRSDFINNFSHEFKTPIVSIAGFAKLLKRDSLTEEQKKEYIDIIEEESLRLSYMATNVLNLTKVENQKILTDVTRFNLSEQIRNCVLLLEYKWSKKNVDLRSERPMARDNKTIGKFKLNGIKMAPAGVPQIEVTFDIDVNGILKVSAKDLDTGKEQSITITDNDKMSDAEIEQAIRDAEQYASNDTTRRSALEILNEANSILYKAEQALSKAGKQLAKDEKKQIKADCGELRKLMMKTKPDKMTESDISVIREAIGRVESSSANACRLAGEENS